MENDDKLFNAGFISLNILVMFSFCNLAVFYDFYNYLNTLPINKEWIGFIIGSLSISALVYRPFISTVLNVKNGIAGVAFELTVTAICLLLYSHTETLFPLIILRLIHGLGYVIFVSSGVVLLMAVMPAERSGQGFGIISISPLIPFAVLPFVIETLFSNLPHTTIYSTTALLILPGLLLLPIISKHIKMVSSASEEQRVHKLPKGSLVKNITTKNVVILLVINGLLYTVYATVFFFLKPFCASIDGANAGIFFMLSTLAVILTRIFLGPVFDKYNKKHLGLFSLLLFTIAVFVLTRVASDTAFYSTALLYGLSFGIITPILNSIMFTVSEPVHRGLNTNLMMEAVDLGYVAGPTLAGVALAGGIGDNMILYSCTFIVITATILMSYLVVRREK